MLLTVTHWYWEIQPVSCSLWTDRFHTAHLNHLGSSHSPSIALIIITIIVVLGYFFFMFDLSNKLSNKTLPSLTVVLLMTVNWPNAGMSSMNTDTTLSQVERLRFAIRKDIGKRWSINLTYRRRNYKKLIWIRGYIHTLEFNLGTQIRCWATSQPTQFSLLKSTCRDNSLNLSC